MLRVVVLYAAVFVAIVAACEKKQVSYTLTFYILLFSFCMCITPNMFNACEIHVKITINVELLSTFLVFSLIYKHFFNMKNNVEIVSNYLLTKV